MTNEFEIATENLYSVFSKYPLKSTIEGCPCCVTDSDRSTLHSKDLRKLQDEDLSRYAFKAMSTWGDVTDFKHYLPRIFELASTRKLIVDTFVVLGKLEYSKWEDWEDKEVETLTTFLESWWKYDINTNSYFDSELLIEIGKLTKDLPSMLANWNIDLETQGFRNYIELIEYHYHELKGKNKTFSELSEQQVNSLIKWIEANSTKLEDGFFKFENDDKKFSERISNTQYMFERIK